jgi:hypothetical protein
MHSALQCTLFYNARRIALHITAQRKSVAAVIQRVISNHTNTPIGKYTNTPIHQYTNTNTSTQIHKYTNTKIQKYNQMGATFLAPAEGWCASQAQMLAMV